MNDEQILLILNTKLAGQVADVSNPAPHRIFLTVEPKDLVAVIGGLKEAAGLWFLSTISGVDLGEQFELVYHFGHDHGNLNVRTRIPKSAPRVESITPHIPGAILYERELQDMFGLKVDHIPDPRPLVLPDDWPAENYPLCKAWKHIRPEEKIPGGKS
jgi:Ni,Fe-hydrogenase III component G